MKIATISGARPQFIKGAPVTKAVREKGLEEILIHTGQHYDDEMSSIFFRDLNLPEPDYNLGVGSGSHGQQTGKMLIEIEKVLVAEKPDLVLVYGDTNSTLAGALAACKLNIPLAHVEAGLRSFNRQMPEEHNRVITDHCADLLFCPTKTAVINLAKESITSGVHLVGDVMYDAVLLYRERIERNSLILERLAVKNRKYILVTVHRAENTDNLERLGNIMKGLEKIAAEYLPVIFPVHPRTRKQFTSAGMLPIHVRLIEPISYFDMLKLEKHAKIILTDSGGVQKEAFFFRVPCITLRDETEWVETVEAGGNVLVGYDSERIVDAVKVRSISNQWENLPYGDGRAAEKIAQKIAEHTYRSL